MLLLRCLAHLCDDGTCVRFRFLYFSIGDGRPLVSLLVLFYVGAFLLRQINIGCE